MIEFTRRSFLAGVGAATAGLALGVRTAGARLATGLGRPLAPNPFLQIGSDGQVTIWCHRSEMGQGIRSSLPILIADELGADPAHIHVIQADGDEKYGDQDTDGSASIRGPWDSARQAAAAVRMMLITAAAQHWHVPEKRLSAHDDAVHDGNRSIAFRELVTVAATLPVPKTITLRPTSEYAHVGKQLPLREAPDMVTGRAIYGADVILPGMLTAVIARPPAVFGSVKKLDPARAKAIPGVKAIVELPAPRRPINFQTLGGVAVIADHTWSAMRGRAALDIAWEPGPNGGYDSAAYEQQLLAAVRSSGEVARKVGDAEAALAKAHTRVEAEYVVPQLAHTPMEPPAAVAHFDRGRCEVWACTQSPQGVQDQIAAELGIPKKDVTVHVTLLGGGFGRKSFPDFAVEAAKLSKHVGAPVRVQWTRDDDIRHSSYHTPSAQALAAGLDDKGNVIAWRHRIAYPSITSTFSEHGVRPSASELGMGVADMPLDIPNITVETGLAPAMTRIGWLRSVCNIQQVFAIQSFIAELAHATKRDPRDMLMTVLGPARTLTAAGQGVKDLGNYGSTLDKDPIDVARLHRVIEKVTNMAGWDARAGRALGLAAHRSFVSYVAVVAQVAKGRHGEPRVEEAWIAADAGIVINPDRVRYQMEGSFVFSMSHTLHQAITVKAGGVVESNFHDYRLARMSEAPRAIHVELIPSEARPGGAGEPGVPPVAPAIANAWFALTGERVRKLPMIR